MPARRAVGGISKGHHHQHHIHHPQQKPRKEQQQQQRPLWLSAVWLLALAAAMHCGGLYLFSEGYLLARLDLEQTGSCATTAPWDPAFEWRVASKETDNNNSSSSNNNDNNNNNKKQRPCWPSARFERVVLVVIDALRFDFAAYDETVAPGDTPHYINKLPVLRDELRDHPGRALLFRGLADPPTTTLQRLMALMTGALPTLVDAGSNFADGGDGVMRSDSLMRQLKQRWPRDDTKDGGSGPVVAIGDDTWARLFPDLRADAVPFASFDVWDLHSVDRGVVDHLFPALGRRPAGWKLLIAHFLGVDHAGHRYGPGHPAMGDKLAELNNVIARVLQVVDDDTLVVVIGDHGMDAKGDHGGDSDCEVDAALFLYSKRPLIDTAAAVQSARSLIVDGLARLDASEFATEASHPFGVWGGHRVVQQIDFAATIAVLMGLPIPFSSLGTVIPETLLVSERNKWWGSRGVSAIENLLGTTRINALQLRTYINEYSRRRPDAATSFADTNRLFEEAEHAFKSLVFPSTTMGIVGAATRVSSTQDLVDCYLLHVKYLRSTLLIARRIWARFESLLMIMGDIILVGSVIVMAAIVVVCWNEPMMTPRPIAIASGFAATSIIGLASPIRRVFRSNEDPATTILRITHEVLFFGLLGALIALAHETVRHWRQTQFNPGTVTQHKIRPFLARCIAHSGKMGPILAIAYAGCVGSDSFTIFEDHVLLHFLQFLAMVSIVRALMFVPDRTLSHDILVRNLALFIMTRAVHGSTICRPDQGPFCEPTFNMSAESSIAAPHTPVFLGIVAVVVVVALRYMLESRGLCAGIGRLFAQRLFPLGVFLSFVYWVLDTVEAHEAAMPSDMHRVKYLVAKTFWVIGALCIVHFCVWPCCVDVIDDHGEHQRLPIMPRLDMAWKRWFGSESKSVMHFALQHDRLRTSAGTYLVFFAWTYLQLAFFQKPMGGVILGITFLQILCLIDSAALWRRAATDERRRIIKKRDDTLNVTTNTVFNSTESGSKQSTNSIDISGIDLFHTVAVLLIGQRAFFSTGHQNALPSIQYEMGFVGLGGLSWVLSPFFIALNTYGGPILASVAVPLVVLWGHDDDTSPVSTFSTTPTPSSEVKPAVHVDTLIHRIVRTLILFHGVISATEMTSATVFAGWFQKHSQAWRVWGPKFLFYSIGHMGNLALCIVFCVGVLAMVVDFDFM